MNELEQRIDAEIAQKGGIPFSRFMELALYEPGLGYYETHREVGRDGDFFTSVSVGSLYGELLAFQFAEWLEEMEGPVQLVEAGAHDGRLAHDILGHLRDWRPAVFERCEMVLWETSATHRTWQGELLSEFAQKVKWESEGRKFRGLFYCNELLDACLVDRYVWNKDQQSWNLGVVQSSNGKLEWDVFRLPGETDPQRHDIYPIKKLVPPEAIPDGFVCMKGDCDVWRTACNCLVEGRALAVDYWSTEKQDFESQAANGTLRGYYQHHPVENVLERPGQVDITTSVNETDVICWIHEDGLECKPLTRQASFLVSILEKTMQQPERFPEWTPARTRQFQTLVHPEHLGHTFKVLECWRP